MKKITLIVFLLLLFSSFALLQILPIKDEISWKPAINFNSVLLKNVQTNQTIFWNETITSYVGKSDCTLHLNLSKTSCIVINSTIKFYNQTTTLKEHQEICIDGKCTDISTWDVWCYDNSTAVTCLSNFDGGGLLKQKNIIPGSSYFVIDFSKNIVSVGDYYKGVYDRLLKEKIRNE